jgi:hypothetical protein
MKPSEFVYTDGKMLEELFRPCVALRDDEHWAVFISMFKDGKARSLTEMRERFGLTYHEMKPVLEDLIVGGLVEQFIIYESDYGNLDERYYRISIKGVCFYVRMFDVIVPGRKNLDYR